MGLLRKEFTARVMRGAKGSTLLRRCHQPLRMNRAISSLDDLGRADVPELEISHARASISAQISL